MKTWRRLLYLACFLGLAVTVALVIDRVARPSMAALLVAAAAAGTLAGAPGLVSRRAWPLSLLLIPLGAYLLLRAQVALPVDARGFGGQVGYIVDQLAAGGRAYAHDAFPLNASEGNDIRVLLSMTVYLAVGVAAFIGLGLRRALPAIVILLAVLGFGFTTDESARVVWAPLAFLLLAGCLLLFSRSLQRERWRVTDAAAGAVTATIAALLALSLVGATSVAASEPLRDWRTWGLAAPDSVHLGFNWMENYPGLLDPATDTRVMRVRSPVASYWRANTLGAFSGVAWLAGASFTDPLRAEEASSSHVYRVPARPPEPPGRLVTEVFQIESTYTEHLFTGGTAKAVRLPKEVSLQVTDSSALVISPQAGPALEYAVDAVIPRLRPADLVGRGRNYPAAVSGQYSDLPFPKRSELRGRSPRAAWSIAVGEDPDDREWLGLYDLNSEIVGAETDPYLIALAIEGYLRSRFEYSLAPPDAGYRSPYAEFLLETGVGYCQHFAGAMAVLLRFNGVPARVAVGFSTGDDAGDGTFLVSRNDAHAWVETYFPGIGWVPFDPTPGRRLPGAGASSTNSGAGSLTADAGADAGGAADEAPGGETQVPGRGADRGGAGSGATEPTSGAGRLPLAVAAAVVAIGWPALRAALRRRRLRRGDETRRLSAELAFVYADLAEHGVGVPRSQTLDETAALVRARFGLDAGKLVERVQAVLFGGRAATRRDVADVAAFRRELRRRLRARWGWPRRILSLYVAPPPRS